jgi:hypothetical protein
MIKINIHKNSNGLKFVKKKKFSGKNSFSSFMNFFVFMEQCFFLINGMVI